MTTTTLTINETQIGSGKTGSVSVAESQLPFTWIADPRKNELGNQSRLEGHALLVNLEQKYGTGINPKELVLIAAAREALAYIATKAPHFPELSLATTDAQTIISIAEKLRTELGETQEITEEPRERQFGAD